MTIRKKQDIGLLFYSKINSLWTRKINAENKPTKHLKKTKDTFNRLMMRKTLPSTTKQKS